MDLEAGIPEFRSIKLGPLIYHAINRGNNRADVLGPDGERDMFLGDLARTKARYPFALFGYCLMSNHFHLLLKPAPGQSISRILQSLTVAHTWRHHRRQGTSGHVWQGRFRSPVIQEGDHLLVVLRYIEANPVRAAMVADPCKYTWSSHRCHGAGHADPILDSFPEWEQLGRTEPERRARWRRKVRGEQPAKDTSVRLIFLEFVVTSLISVTYFIAAARTISELRRPARSLVY